MHKIIYSLLFIYVVSLFSSEAQEPVKDFAGGKGTTESPYLIENPSQLSKIRNYTGAGFNGVHFKLTRNIEFKKSDFELNGEFYNSGKGWEPIGNEQKKFEGIFEGAGKTIVGLRSGERKIMGLFGMVRGGVIKNLTLRKCEYLLQNGKMSVSVGGIVAIMERTTVDHCRFMGKMTIINEESSEIGGIVGGFHSGEVSCCFSQVEIKAESARKNKLDVGGIAGIVYDPIGVRDCYADVSLKCSGDGSVGGIVGRGQCMNGRSSIVRCYVKGDIFVTTCVGGIAGGVESAYAVTNNFTDLKIIERKDNTEYGYNLKRVAGWLGASRKLNNNYASSAIVLKGRREKLEENLQGMDGMQSQDYTKKEFWENLGFVFGNSTQAPWVFTKGSLSLYGFDDSPVRPNIAETSIDTSTGLGASFFSMKKIYDNECVKLKMEAQNNKTLLLKELINSYDSLLSKELDRIGDTNLELAAAIQLEQGKLKQADAYSFSDTKGIPEITKLRKPFGGRLIVLELESAEKLKKAEDALVLKYIKALSDLQKKSVQNKDFALALHIKKEIDFFINESGSSQE